MAAPSHAGSRLVTALRALNDAPQTRTPSLAGEMSPMTEPFHAAPALREPSAVLLTAIAIAVGVLVANLYYAQPLVAAIAPEIGVSPDLAGTVVSVSQIGYGLGLLLLVPLADLLENKALTLSLLGLTTVGLIGTALSAAAAPFFAAAFLIGFCATGAQVLVPFVSHLVPPERRGRVVGNVMAGLLTGIMLARPAALFVAAGFGWRVVFWGSAGLMVLVGLVLAALMPKRHPPGGMGYGTALLSMGRMVRQMPELRRRALGQALLFAAFNLLWTAVPLALSRDFGLTDQQIGWFALAGAGGALAAPVAGRLADRGLGGIGGPLAVAALGLSFLASGWAVGAGALYVLVALTVIIDAAVQTSMVMVQRVVFSVPAEVRGRANAIFMTTLFMGGAVGSTLATLAWHAGGWPAIAGAGTLAAALALALLWPRRTA